MRIKYKLQQTFAIILIFTLIFAMFPGAVGAEKTQKGTLSEDVSKKEKPLEEQSSNSDDNQESKEKEDSTADSSQGLEVDSENEQQESSKDKQNNTDNFEVDLQEEHPQWDKSLENTNEQELESNNQQEKNSEKDLNNKEEQQQNPEDIKKEVHKSIENAKKYYENNPAEYNEQDGYHSEYWMFSALWGAGYENLREDFPWTESNPWSDHTYWAKGLDERASTANEEAGIILGSLLLGKDPSAFGERNVIQDLLERQNDNGLFSTLWGEPWALIALELVEAKYDREKQIESILEQQSSGGQFGDADATGWILTALAPYINDENVKAAIDRSIEWAHDEFMQHDEFPGMFGPNANSTASVVMGLAAVGEDLYSLKWTKENGGLVEDLIEYQQDDGSFWWQKDEPGAVGMATEQALLAIATVENSQSIFIDLKDDVKEIVGTEESENSESHNDYTKVIDKTVKKAVEFTIENGVVSEWEAIAIARAGYEVPNSYEDVFYNSLDAQVVDTRRLKITDLERLVMAAQVINLDPTDVNEINLIEKIYNSKDNENGSDIMTFQGSNGPIFALIALDSGEYSVPENARWTREKLVNYLLDEQNEDGSWSLFGTDPSYDITAMALIAFGNYKEDEKVSEAIDKAVSFLSESQNNEGGFYDPWNGGISLETAAQVMIGLTSVGIDPLGKDFTKENGNLLDHILTFTADDGGFSHLPGDTVSNNMSTEQGIQSMVAYQLYLNRNGGLYHFVENDEEIEDDLDSEDEEKEEDLEPEDDKVDSDSDDNSESGEDEKEKKEEDSSSGDGKKEGEDDSESEDDKIEIEDDSESEDDKIEIEDDSSLKGEQTDIDQGATKEEEAGDELPKTATNTYTVMFIGILLLVLSGLMFVIRKLKITRS